MDFVSDFQDACTPLHERWMLTEPAVDEIAWPDVLEEEAGRRQQPAAASGTLQAAIQPDTADMAEVRDPRQR